MQTCPPYRPLRGAEPPHFVDRPELDGLGPAGALSTVLGAVSTGPSDPRFQRLVVAGEAMGKTAFLRSAARQVRQRLGWAVAFHTCHPKQRALGTVVVAVLEAMARQWPEHQTSFAQQVLRPRLGAGAARGPTGAHPAGRALLAIPPGVGPLAEASWAELRAVLQSAGSFAKGVGRGALVVLDDIDSLVGGEAEALGWLARALACEGLPVSLLMSCGPDFGRELSDAGNFSYSLWPSCLGALERSEVAEALVVPASERGVGVDASAVELVYEISRGRPLEVQRAAFAAWSMARDNGRLTRADVEAGSGLTADRAMARAS